MNSFDQVASVYDSGFTRTSIGEAQRSAVRRFSLPFLSSPKKILELNCGTGEDAIWLDSLGHTVLATDASPEMIKVVKGKLSRTSIQAHQLLIENIGSIEDKFDLVFSNFGGLNCLSPEKLTALKNDLAEKLNPSGEVILVVMGRKCVWERLYFSLKGKSREAGRRLQKSAVRASIGDTQVETWYYSPEEFKATFDTEFTTTLIRPVGLVVPPSYLQPFFNNKQWLINTLEFLDGLISFPFLSNHADHFLIVLKKKQ